MKKILYPANFAFIKEFDKSDRTAFEVECKYRKTKKHHVRQMNVKTTAFYG